MREAHFLGCLTKHFYSAPAVLNCTYNILQAHSLTYLQKHFLMNHKHSHIDMFRISIRY